METTPNQVHSAKPNAFTSFVKSFWGKHSKTILSIAFMATVSVLTGILVGGPNTNSATLEISSASKYEISRLESFGQNSSSADNILADTQVLAANQNKQECNQAAIVFTALYMEVPEGATYDPIRSQLHTYAEQARACNAGYVSPSAKDLEDLFL